MLTNERQNQILKILKSERRVTVKTLAKTLFVSEITIRRDLNEMQKLGLIDRCHGGAVIANNAEEVSLFVRMVKNAKQKENIASLAINKLPAYSCVFIDGSTTALALVERMNLEHKTVVTYNLQTALQLSKKTNVNLIILGGTVEQNTVSATGSWTARQVNEFNFDLMISSCSSIINNEIYERSIDQKEIKKNAILRSKYKILLVDSSKFNKSASYKSSEICDYDLIITDKKPEINFEIKNLIY